MTDETPRPKGKRRRGLIAAVVLLVVGGVGWWNWPRGDARLVGKWSYRAEGGTAGVMTLRANGTAISEMPPNYRMRCSWRVESERLILGSSTGAEIFPLSVRRWLTVNLRNWTGTLYSFGQSELSIVQVSRDRLVLRVGTEDRTIVYERVVD
jgi:hypothetical protein